MECRLPGCWVDVVVGNGEPAEDFFDFFDFLLASFWKNLRETMQPSKVWFYLKMQCRQERAGETVGDGRQRRIQKLGEAKERKRDAGEVRDGEAEDADAG